MQQRIDIFKGIVAQLRNKVDAKHEEQQLHKKFGKRKLL